MAGLLLAAGFALKEKVDEKRAQRRARKQEYNDWRYSQLQLQSNFSPLSSDQEQDYHPYAADPDAASDRFDPHPHLRSDANRHHKHHRHTYRPTDYAYANPAVHHHHSSVSVAAPRRPDPISSPSLASVARSPNPNRNSVVSVGEEVASSTAGSSVAGIHRDGSANSVVGTVPAVVSNPGDTRGGPIGAGLGGSMPARFSVAYGSTMEGFGNGYGEVKKQRRRSFLPSKFSSRKSVIW